MQENIKSPQSSKFDYIFILKVLAIVFITNSHFKSIYSDNLSRFAFGGAMGCGIFFWVSGYTLNSCNKKTFLKWISKRIIRIYPALWIFYAATGSYYSWTVFLWPHLWFLKAILCFYVLFYFYAKYFKKYYRLILLGLLFAFLVEYYFINHSCWMIDNAVNPYKIHWIYYFGFMIIGAKAREKSQLKEQKVQKTQSLLLVLLSFSLFICTYGLKFLCINMPILMNLQILFPLLLLASCSAIFKMVKTIKLKGIWGNIVKWIAGLTLEIYIVQEWIIAKLNGMLEFPIRLFVTLGVIVVTAFVLHWITQKLTNPIINYLNK